MTEKAPAFQFYARDYLTEGKVRRMPWAARGVYVDLLCTYWLDGGLPNNPAALARMVGMTTKKFAALWVHILPCFEANGNALIQKRMQAELAKTKAFREKQSENGKNGGRPKGINGEKNPSLFNQESQHEATSNPNESSASATASAVTKPPSSPFVDSRTDADAARADVRDALADWRNRNPNAAGGESDDELLASIHRFHAPSGPVRLSSENVNLLRATAAKIRADGRPKPPRARKVTAPAFDRGADHAVTEADTAWDYRLGPRPATARATDTPVAASGSGWEGASASGRAPSQEAQKKPLPALTLTVAPGACPVCSSPLRHTTEGVETVLRCDQETVPCEWAAVWRSVAA